MATKANCPNQIPSNGAKENSREVKSDHDDEKSSGCSLTSQTSDKQDPDADLFTTDVNSPQDTKTDLSLKRSRKSYQWIRRTVNKALWGLKNTDEIKDNYNFSLKISNFPTNWGLEEIKDVIINDYGPVDYIYMATDDNLSFIGMVKLEFVSFTDCQKAWETFHGKTVEEIRLFAEMRDLDEESDDEAAPAKKKRCNCGPWRPDIDVWETDPKGLYGFQPEYLSSLGIQPPLQKWVQVTNFRCDKSELKEVMELAGQVLLCTVDTRASKIGHVMYSHPLEAVQAVSMLNNQQFYGQPVKVTMEKCPGVKALLPKGLQGVGSGLGADGNPLRDIVKQYERFAQYKSSYVNSTLFSDPDVLFANIPESERHIPMNGNKNRDYSNYQNVYPSSNPFKYHRSTSLNSGVSNFGPQDGPTVGQLSQGLSGPMLTGNVDGSWSTSGSRQNVGPGPMAGPGTMSSSVSIGRPGFLHGGPMSGPGSMPGPSSISGPGLMQGPGPMSGPGSMQGPGPMSGPVSMQGLGPMSGSVSMQGVGPMSSPGSMQGSGLMSGPGSMQGPGPMSGPGSMQGSGPMSGPVTMQGPGPMTGLVSMQGTSAMTGPGPILGPGAMSGPVPMQGPVLMRGQGPISNPMQGRGPNAGPVSMQGPGPISGPVSMQVSGHLSGPRPMSGPGAMAGPSAPAIGTGPQNAPRPMGANCSTPDKNIAVELSNLPLSTTFTLLCEKMAECGQVMSVRLTTPGSAVVQFAQRQHADRCFRLSGVAKRAEAPARDRSKQRRAKPTLFYRS